MPDPNWVAARAECSVARVFERLRAGVRDDVGAVHQLPGRNQEFAIDEEQDRLFSVIQERGHSRIVRFWREEDGVRVQAVEAREQDWYTLRGSPVLAAEADRCLLRVDDQLCEEWQFRRLALERFFFPDKSDA
jgi:hypothetical protein